MSDLERAVERLGRSMETMGLPRMPARVFSFILADDQSVYTAAELAAGVGVSPASVSGAVRYLSDTHLVVRERNPAGRGDVFRVRDGNIWATIQASRLPVLDRIIDDIHVTVELLPIGSAGRERVQETEDYFTFLREDADGLNRRWRAWRESHHH